MRQNTTKHTLADGGTSVGTWLSLCSPVAARFLARVGFDWLTVDIEHSAANWETAAAIFAHTAEAGCVPLARIPEARHDYIKRVLDNGAYGFVVPMVMTPEEAEMCVKAAKYPPTGNRSLGGNVHALNFDATPRDYYAKMNDEVLVVLQCEHIAAVERAEEIFAVPGIDAIFVGPNDLRASMRDASGNDPSPEVFEAALARILAACQKNGVAAGIHCFSSAQIQQRRDEGWRFMALGSDLSLMTGMAQSELQALKGDAGRAVANY